MHYEFIEIGTSNFATLTERATDKTVGLAVEPVFEYLSQLPDKPLVRKLHCAISQNNQEEDAEIYYIPEAVIQMQGLPWYLKGCNTVGSFHKQHEWLGVTHLVERQRVRSIPISRLFLENDVSSCDVLKIDTEGSDCDILIHLAAFLTTQDRTVFPRKIIFEANALTSKERADSAVAACCSLGYAIENYCYPEDTSTLVLPCAIPSPTIDHGRLASAATSIEFRHMNTGGETILVIIPAYMDNELEATIASLIDGAADPSLLDIVVINQDDETRTAPQFPDCVSLVNIHYSKSRGVAWARSLLNSFLSSTHTYVLNIDSHMRFDTNWDLILKNALNRYPGKAVISAYPGQYFVSTPERTNGNVINYIDGVKPDWCVLVGSRPAAPDKDGFIRFGILAAGFNFAARQFWEDVPVDPNLDWNWEQIDPTVRAFTYGYDIVNIPSPPIYHLYTHENRKPCTRRAWKVEEVPGQRFCSKLPHGNELPAQMPFGLGQIRSLAEFESLHGVNFQECRFENMISIPVAVHNSLFEWQLSLFWFGHRMTYGHIASRKAMAAIVERNGPFDIPQTQLTWSTSVPHLVVRPYFEYFSNIEPSDLAVPLNIQSAVSQVLAHLQDDQVVEILDCDMCHIRPAPYEAPPKNVLFVCDIYEDWHLHSFATFSDIVRKRTGGSSDYYNGGFVPIIGHAGTLRRILPAWTEAHIDILRDQEVGSLQKWWAGMYALQVACERLQVRMQAKDYLYVPGINSLMRQHYIVHYSCDPKFDKKTFPEVRPERFDDNLFYEKVRYWLFTEWNIKNSSR